MDNNEKLVVGKFCGIKVSGTIASMKLLEVRITDDDETPVYDPMMRVEFWIDGPGTTDRPTAVLFAATKEDLQHVYEQLCHELDNVVLVIHRW